MVQFPKSAETLTFLKGGFLVQELFSFNNCSRKIKTFAKVLLWLMLIAGLIMVVAGIITVIQSLAGVALLIGGFAVALSGWISSLFIYGFGVIVAAHEGKGTNEAEYTSSTSAKRSASKIGGPCPICGYMLDATMKSCPNCSKVSISTLKVTDKGWLCPKCNNTNPHHVGTCEKCGETKPY